MLGDVWIQGSLGITEVCPSRRYLSLGGVGGFLEEVAFGGDLKAQVDFCNWPRRAVERGEPDAWTASSCSTTVTVTHFPSFPHSLPSDPRDRAGWGQNVTWGDWGVLQGEFGAGLHRADGGAGPAAGAEFSAG